MPPALSGGRNGLMAKPDGDVSEQLRVLARLTALTIVAGKTQAEAIGLLARSGMNRGEIAAVCGTTPDVVSVRLAEARRKKRK